MVRNICLFGWLPMINQHVLDQTQLLKLLLQLDLVIKHLFIVQFHNIEGLSSQHTMYL